MASESFSPDLLQSDPFAAGLKPASGSSRKKVFHAFYLLGFHLWIQFGRVATPLVQPAAAAQLLTIGMKVARFPA